MKRCLPIFFVLFFSACEQAPPASSSPRPALVVTVSDRIAATPTVLIGEIRSRYESEQGFRIAGKIIKRYVDVGAHVDKGQILVRLDSLDTGLTARAAQARVQAAEADLALAQAELNRLQKLYQRQFVSAQAVDVQEAKTKSATAVLKESRAQAAVSSNQSTYTELLAERQGVVTAIRAEPGQVVEEGETIVRIAMPDSMEVEIAVPESRMNDVAIDKAVEVRLWANPSLVYAGKVREIAPAADTITRTFRVRISLPSVSGNGLRLGMTAGVRFYPSDSLAFVLPLPSVAQYDGKTVVWRLHPDTGEVYPHPVQTGMYREDGVVVTQGLNPGDQVVVAGVQTLVPGQIVRPQAVQQTQ